MKTELRERTFVWSGKVPSQQAWLAGDVVKSAMFNIMSLGVGAHEARIMRTFKNVDQQVKDPSVREDVKALIGQEARHYRAHDPLNFGLIESDAYLRGFYERLRYRHLQSAEESTYEAALGYLLATEFSFGCMGRAILSNDRFFDGADPDLSALWIYHAIEELEHTRVSFDVVNDHFGEHGVPRLLEGSLRRVLGYERGDLTRDADLQEKFTDKLRFMWISDFVDAVTAESMRGIGIRDIFAHFMGDECLLFRRSAGWYDLFDPTGWHPSQRYDEDQRLIDRWDTFLQKNGYLA